MKEGIIFGKGSVGFSRGETRCLYFSVVIYRVHYIRTAGGALTLQTPLPSEHFAHCQRLLRARAPLLRPLLFTGVTLYRLIIHQVCVTRSSSLFRLFTLSAVRCAEKFLGSPGKSLA
jgi:hypothetical protein